MFELCCFDFDRKEKSGFGRDSLLHIVNSTEKCPKWYIYVTYGNIVCA